MTSWGVLDDFVLRAAAVLRAEVDATVTVRHDGAEMPTASSSRAAARCEAAGARAAAGPSGAAMDRHRVQLVARVAHETWWPDWAAQAAREGFASALAVPASVAPGVDLALTLYSRAADPWDPGLLVAADGYAQLAAAHARALAAGPGHVPARRHEELADAVLVERAVGAIMHTNGCSAEEAHRILGSASSNRNVSRSEAARRILQALLDVEDPARSR